jgi:iron complex outermembrane recepter protein
MNRNRLLEATCGFALLSIVPTHASAQTAPAEQRPPTSEGPSQQATTPTLPQSSAPQTAAIADIVVTGSRIAASGFKQPTPVTVIGAEQFKQTLQPNISNFLNELPAFGPPVGTKNPPTAVSGAGLSLLNLRDLGVQRTLVLLDGRRVVNSTVSSGVDINTLPNTLIQRVDVVTGGASAAYGADAVAGVVNFVLNKKFRGLEIAAQGGAATNGLDPSYKVDLTFGHELFGGRGSIVAAVTYSDEPNLVRARQLNWWKGYAAVVNNPAYTPTNGQPRQITVQNAGLINTSAGGVIISGALAGTQFVGNSVNVPYNGGLNGGLLQSGGDVFNLTSQYRNITIPLQYTNAFAHLDYDVSDNIHAYVEGSYGRSVVRSDTVFPNRAGITIQADNAFLPDTVKAALAAAGQTSFTMNKVLTDAGPAGANNRRQVWRVVAGLDGTIGSWKWGAYYQHGEANILSTTFGNPILANFSRAIDAVQVTPANVGSSGLRVGSIACRSSLTDPGNGCSPYNAFGNGVASAQALNYVFGTAPFQKTILRQDFASIEASGPVFNLPAGPVNLAIGADYDHDSAVGTQDALSQARAYQFGNFQSFDGTISFKEVFGEVSIPLLKDLPLARDLSASAAGRMTDYSTSGVVYTWKVGLTDQMTSDLRPRITFSRDIRAPDLNSLFSQGVTNLQNLFDPVTNRNYVSLPGISRGNPNLKPEKADTLTVGAAFSPHWVPGLNISVDYYHIKLKGAIATLTSPQVVAQCLAGNAALCANINRAPDGTLQSILLNPINVNSITTSGVDFELAYRKPVGSGVINVRGLATYQPQLDVRLPSGLFHYAGSLVDNALGGAIFQGGVPKWKGQASVGYTQGPASITGRVRYIGSGKLVNSWVEGVDVDRNHVPAVAYLDIFGSYDFNVSKTQMTLSFAVNNVINKSPPIIPVTSLEGTDYGAGTWPNTRLDLYDALGRTFTVALKAKF